MLRHRCKDWNTVCNHGFLPGAALVCSGKFRPGIKGNRSFFCHQSPGDTGGFARTCFRKTARNFSIHLSWIPIIASTIDARYQMVSYLGDQPAWRNWLYHVTIHVRALVFHSSIAGFLQTWNNCRFGCIWCFRLHRAEFLRTYRKIPFVGLYKEWEKISRDRLKKKWLPLGNVLWRLKSHTQLTVRDVIDHVIIFVWGPREKRVITGAEILGRLVQGV